MFRSAVLLLVMSFCLVGAQSDVQAFVDSTVNGWDYWGWASAANINLANTSPVQGGTKSIRWTPSNWEAIYFHANTPLTSANFVSLEFYVHGGTTGGQNIVLAFNQNAASNPHPTVAVLGGSIPANTWTKVTVSFSSIGLTSGSIVEFWFQANSASTQGTLYVDSITFKAGTPPPPTGVAVVIDTSSNVRAINQQIYGVSFADATHFKNVKYPLNRNGGNSATRYNWEKSISNKGSDWFYFNIPDDVANEAALPEGSSSDVFVTATKNAGSTSMLTAPLIGYTPVDQRVKKWGYSVAKYGAQQKTECTETGGAFWCTADAGNGVRPDGTQITTNDWRDTSKQIGAPYVQSWMAHLTARGTPVRMWSLDNEPALWSSTHADLVHSGVTYSDLWSRTATIGRAIKTTDSLVKNFGPAAWGWCEYFYSAADGCSNGPDKASHGNMDFLEWYAQQVCQYNATNNVKVVDYLDIHYYPQSGVSLNSLEDSATAAKRLRSLKSLYDPTYIDESWIGQAVNLIPRMRSIISSRCSWLKLSISEYNFGNDDIITGALAQAEALAIFGREGVAAAMRWVAPAPNTLVENAFKLFLNYTGTGAQVTGSSVKATSNDVDTIGAYAIINTSTSTIFALAFNKATSTKTVNFTISNRLTLSGAADVYQFSQASPSLRKLSSTLTVTNGAFSLLAPAWSASLDRKSVV